MSFLSVLANYVLMLLAAFGMAASGMAAAEMAVLVFGCTMLIGLSYAYRKSGERGLHKLVGDETDKPPAVRAADNGFRIASGIAAAAWVASAMKRRTLQPEYPFGVAVVIAVAAAALCNIRSGRVMRRVSDDIESALPGYGDESYYQRMAAHGYTREQSDRIAVAWLTREEEPEELTTGYEEYEEYEQPEPEPRRRSDWDMLLGSSAKKAGASKPGRTGAKPIRGYHRIDTVGICPYCGGHTKNGVCTNCKEKIW